MIADIGTRHSSVSQELNNRFGELNIALETFVSEMKAGSTASFGKCVGDVSGSSLHGTLGI